MPWPTVSGDDGLKIWMRLCVRLWASFSLRLSNHTLCDYCRTDTTIVMQTFLMLTVVRDCRVLCGALKL